MSWFSGEKQKQKTDNQKADDFAKKYSGSEWEDQNEKNIETVIDRIQEEKGKKGK